MYILTRTLGPWSLYDRTDDPCNIYVDDYYDHNDTPDDDDEDDDVPKERCERGLL